MRPDQAQEVMRRAEEERQPLPLSLKKSLFMSDEPTPQLLEIHKEPGTYPPFLDQCAKSGFRGLVITFSKYPRTEGREEKIIMSATVDETKGLTATIAAKNLAFWEQTPLGGPSTKPPTTRKARKKKQAAPPYQFPDTEAGHA